MVKHPDDAKRCGCRNQVPWLGSIGALRFTQCILGADGKVVERFDVSPDSKALCVLVSRLRKAWVAKVAIEISYGPVAEDIDRCRSRGFVAPSRQIKASRPVTARQATRMTVSTHTSSRTRYAPTVTGGRRYERIIRKPKRHGLRAGPAGVSSRFECR